MRPLWLAVLLLAAVACSQDAPSVTKLAEPEQVIDERLMICLNRAKNHHHIADVYVSDGNVDKAIAEVRKVLTVACPAGAPEAQDVQLDARARLAKLLLGRGGADDALQVVDEGIAAATRDSFFLANLYTVRGEVMEALGRKHEAIEAYERSNEINLALQRELYP